MSTIVQWPHQCTQLPDYKHPAIALCLITSANRSRGSLQVGTLLCRRRPAEGAEAVELRDAMCQQTLKGAGQMQADFVAKTLISFAVHDPCHHHACKQRQHAVLQCVHEVRADTFQRVAALPGRACPRLRTKSHR